MPAVLVHGVPETDALWEPLREHLGREDVIALRLPGFGIARPDGFNATKEDYVAWLVRELEGITGPIDLVGHDWGGGFVVRVVSTRADLIRSWATDAAGIGDVQFEWHDFAKIWQTPDEGEKFWADQLTTPPEQRAGMFEIFGVPRDLAVRLASAVDETMAGCILNLYRSATDVGREWGPDFHDVPKPGLVLVPSEDAFLDPERAKAVAALAGARVASLDGVGHWWMLQEPERCAAILRDFWTEVV